MNNQIDKNELFYDRYLGEPDRRTPAIVTGLGLASFRVINEKLLDKIKQITEMDEVEGEFAFIRNTHLHYTPSNHRGVVSSGVLTFRTCKTGGNSKISQFIVETDDNIDVYRIKPFGSLDSLYVVRQNPTHQNYRDDLANAIGFQSHD